LHSQFYFLYDGVGGVVASNSVIMGTMLCTESLDNLIRRLTVRVVYEESHLNVGLGGSDVAAVRAVALTTKADDVHN